MTRFRFSLRSFFVFATLIAVICGWCVLPTVEARQLVRALADQNYQAADAMFRRVDDRCLVEWDDKLWSFRATGELAPVTIGQLIGGRRLVRFKMHYFAFDQTVNRDGLVVVTTLGAGAPEIGPERYGSRIVDGISSPIIERMPTPRR